MKKVISLVWAIAVIYVLLFVWLLLPFPMSTKRLLFPLVAGLGLGLGVLGGVLLSQVIKEKVTGRLKLYLLLTGVGAIGVPVSVVLHNLVYGIMIFVFGDDIWDKWGMSDEPLFFILGLMIFPLMLIVGIVGSGIEWRKRSQ